MNEPLSDYEKVYYDSELLTQGGGFLDSNTSHFTRLGLPRMSPSSSSPDVSTLQYMVESNHLDCMQIHVLSIVYF